MAQESLLIEDFSGGIARLSEKKDLPNSARMVRDFDVFNEPTALIPFAKTTKDSGTTITDLPLWMVSGLPYSTDQYVYGNAGNIYKRTSGGTWSLDRAGTSMYNVLPDGTHESYNAAGQGLCVYNNYLYYATSFAIGRKGPLAQNGTFTDNFKQGDSTPLLDQSQGNTGQTYTLPNAISESATALCSFTPTYYPVWEIDVFCSTVGTGNWTLTLHDSVNDVIATATLPHSAITTGKNDFIFNTPVDSAYPGALHFHLTSSDGTGAVVTGTTNDFSTAQFNEYFAPLCVANYHPMAVFNNMLVYGNGRYIGTYDTTNYLPNKIVLPPGYEVRTLGFDQEYIVAGCWRGGAIDAFEEGYLFYWDGIAPTYNFAKRTPMGIPHSLVNSKGRLLGAYGTQGRLYLGSEPFVPMLSVPKLKHDGKMEVSPGGMTNWLGLTAIAYGLNTDDGNVYQGVYLWGSYSTTEGLFSYGTPQGIPEVASLGYQISTGNSQSTSVKVGMVQGFGKDLFIGWQDGTSYGVDKVSKGDAPAQSASWESLIFDNGTAAHEKQAQRLVMKFQPLTSGDSFTLKYKIDRAANWTTGTAVTTVGATRADLVVNQRFHEIEIGFDYTTSSSTYQRITSLMFVFDDLKEERMER